MTGTQSQIEWAEQIKPRVRAEFDRVARVFGETAANQTEADRNDTLAVIAILKEMREGVLANPSAGYFIRDWRELNDQVRRMIAGDPRYQAIKAGRTERRA